MQDMTTRERFTTKPITNQGLRVHREVGATADALVQHLRMRGSFVDERRMYQRQFGLTPMQLQHLQTLAEDKLQQLCLRDARLHAQLDAENGSLQLTLEVPAYVGHRRRAVGLLSAGSRMLLNVLVPWGVPLQQTSVAGCTVHDMLVDEGLREECAARGVLVHEESVNVLRHGGRCSG